jgi:hypothetical protein
MIAILNAPQSQTQLTFAATPPTLDPAWYSEAITRNLPNFLPIMATTDAGIFGEALIAPPHRTNMKS